MDQKKKEEIRRVLLERGATQPCPRCGHTEFSLGDGYVSSSVQQDLDGIALGGPAIPSVVVYCNNCGFMSQHALGALGMLPSETEGEEVANE